MNPTSDRKSSHSLQSSRVSNMSNSVPVNIQVKRMQAKLLMDYYRQNEQIKQKQSMQQNVNKNSYGHFQKSLTENYLMQQQAKRSRKQEIKQNLANDYEQMIRLKQQRVRQQRQRQRQIEKKNFQLSKWGTDNRQDFIKQKQMQQQYGKQLQMHLRLQEIMKYQQRVKEKEMINKFQREQQQKNMKYDQNQFNNFKRKEMFEKRQNSILGIDDPSVTNRNNNKTSNNGNSNNPEQLTMDLYNNSFKSIQLTDHNNKRLLKRRQQMLYGSGLQQQLRSQTISPQPNVKSNYHQSQSSIKSQRRGVPEYNFNASEVYNPITNPVQINYKNPYVLRMLAQHNQNNY